MTDPGSGAEPAGGIGADLPANFAFRAICEQWGAHMEQPGRTYSVTSASGETIKVREGTYSKPDGVARLHVGPGGELSYTDRREETRKISPSDFVSKWKDGLNRDFFSFGRE